MVTFMVPKRMKLLDRPSVASEATSCLVEASSQMSPSVLSPGCCAAYQAFSVASVFAP